MVVILYGENISNIKYMGKIMLFKNATETSYWRVDWLNEMWNGIHLSHPL